ncbi:TlpA family protein disulfide reductase [Flavobacterium sp. UBA4197]|uniref:TlpA family protein disulfide reductase n=1 Tax=Flavobacterium sp. UBA4197 TaxID=1946546 RepID=UPI00257F218A|nr:thioredoxin-like domain-containing protein [Flavobacterium sp. UBA4197]
MKKRIIFNLAILLCLTLKIAAQNTVKLTGHIDTVIMNKYKAQELILRAKENASKDNEGITYKVPVTANGNFKTEITLKDSLAYFAFEIADHKISNSIGRYYNVSDPERSTTLSEVYLFERGDSVKMQLKSNKSMLFSGKGSEKLNCQFQLYNIPLSLKAVADRVLALKNESKLKQATMLEAEVVNAQIAQRLILLKSYKEVLKPYIYDLLYLDAVNGLLLQAYSRLPNYLLIYTAKNELLITQEYYNTLVGLDYGESLIQDKLKAKSAFYPNMLLEREFIKLIVFENSLKDHWDSTFTKLYNSLKSNFIGNLRDKLILLCYENFAAQSTDSAKKLYTDAINTMKSDIDQQQLKQLMVKYTSQAYPFTFYDALGKVHKLKDYSGKLIVIDFWFTSCAACAILAKAMHPIHEKFKNYTDVVFITVSTDLKDKWLASLKTDLYTTNRLVNLNTNGKGFNDPMIAYYKFKAFPQQIIIGKQGQLITASPPRPDESNENMISFSKLIIDNL